MWIGDRYQARAGLDGYFAEDLPSWLYYWYTDADGNWIEVGTNPHESDDFAIGVSYGENQEDSPPYEG